MPGLKITAENAEGAEDLGTSAISAPSAVGLPSAVARRATWASSLNAGGRTAAALASTWLPLLREALEREGHFRFPLRGASMRPTLPVACDIEIVPLPAQTPLGALIVFVIDDTLIAHRLVRRSVGRWIAQGDGRLSPDRPLTPEQVLGVVAAAYADGRQCWPTTSSRLLAAFWIARYWALRPARAVRRTLR
jgi:hypothetical protein